MKRIARTAMALLLPGALTLVGFCGELGQSAKQETEIERGISLEELNLKLAAAGPVVMPNDVASKVSQADRLMASDNYIGSMIWISGSAAKGLVRALSSARRTGGVRFDDHRKLDLYRGEKLLTTLWFGNSLFVTSPREGELVDELGLLKALEVHLGSAEAAHQNWLDYLANRVADPATAAKLRAWSEDLLRQLKEGKLKRVPWRDTTESGEICVGGLKFEDVLEPAAQWTFIPHVNVLVHFDAQSKPKCVVLDWFDRYGLLVGSSNGYQTSLQFKYITNVTAGICVFRR